MWEGGGILILPSYNPNLGSFALNHCACEPLACEKLNMIGDQHHRTTTWCRGVGHWCGGLWAREGATTSSRGDWIWSHWLCVNFWCLINLVSFWIGSSIMREFVAFWGYYGSDVRIIWILLLVVKAWICMLVTMLSSRWMPSFTAHWKINFQFRILYRSFLQFGHGGWSVWNLFSCFILAGEILSNISVVCRVLLHCSNYVTMVPGRQEGKEINNYEDLILRKLSKYEKRWMEINDPGSDAGCRECSIIPWW